MKVLKLTPYGYCKGVYDAINTVLSIKEKYPNTPIYCIGQIVHNQYINEKIAQCGIKIIEKDKLEALKEINSGVVIFSAHGTSKKILNKARDKGLIVIDTVCPFVKKGMDIIDSYLKENYEIIYIGKKNHPEAIASTSISNKIHLVETLEDLKQLKINTDKIFLTNQTTISVNDLKQFYEFAKEKYPNLILSDEICSATRIRQENILNLKEVDGLIIVGDQKSNNTKNLLKIANEKKLDAILIENINQLEPLWLKNKETVAVTSGTSTPLELVNEVIDYLKNI